MMKTPHCHFVLPRAQGILKQSFTDPGSNFSRLYFSFRGSRKEKWGIDGISIGSSIVFFVDKIEKWFGAVVITAKLSLFYRWALEFVIFKLLSGPSSVIKLSFEPNVWWNYLNFQALTVISSCRPDWIDCCSYIIFAKDIVIRNNHYNIPQIIDSSISWNE